MRASIIAFAMLIAPAFGAGKTDLPKRPATACEIDNIRLVKLVTQLRAEPDMRFVAIPMNIFKAIADARPKKVAVKKKTKTCKRFNKQKKRCTWWV